VTKAHALFAVARPFELGGILTSALIVVTYLEQSDSGWDKSSVELEQMVVEQSCKILRDLFTLLWINTFETQNIYTTLECRTCKHERKSSDSLAVDGR
jgi:hypothetical protein